MIRICRFCKQDIDDLGNRHKYAAHCTNCDDNPNKKNRLNNIKLAFKNKRISKYGKLKKYKLICFSCNSNFVRELHELKYKKIDKFFCGRKCANKYTSNLDNKKECKESVCVICNKNISINKRASKLYSKCQECKSELKSKPIIQIKNKDRGAVEFKTKVKLKPEYTIECECELCNTKFLFHKRTRFCSVKCKNRSIGTLGGRASALKRVSRSKDEIALFEIIKTQIPSAQSNHIIIDNWDADIVLPDSKIAIFWNGVWHYKQLPMKNHSLLQVQTRDLIKLKLFSEMGWDVLIFEDRYWSPEKAADVVFQLNQSMIYNAWKWNGTI